MNGSPRTSTVPSAWPLTRSFFGAALGKEQLCLRRA